MRLYKFDGVQLNLRLTGSAVFGFELPQDLDYVGTYHKIPVDLLLKRGWTTGTDLSSDPGFGFVSLKKGSVNLILAVNEDFLDRWNKAHDFVLEHTKWGRTKVQRIWAFRHFLYDETIREITKTTES